MSTDGLGFPSNPDGSRCSGASLSSVSADRLSCRCTWYFSVVDPVAEV